MTCSNWRGVEERISWMLAHPPGQVGMCARECWQALGGDLPQPCPSAWGTPDANAVYDKVIASGRYWRTADIPRGALIVWKYTGHGHAALSAGGGKIVTTDPPGKPGGTGIAPLSLPEAWGGSASQRIWTDQYNSVRFDVGAPMAAADDILDYKYLGKPSGVLVLTRAYKSLDLSYWDPPRTGWENTQCYLNIDPTFAEGKTHGAIRVRLVREDGDDTGHDDIPIDVDDLDDDGRTLRRWLYWEQGQRGASSKVQLKCIGGMASATLYTRYTKKATVVGT